MSKVVLRALDLIGDHLRTHKSGGGADAPLDLAKQVVQQRMDNPAPAAPPVAEAAPKNTTQGSVFAPKPRVVAPSGLYSHAAEVAGQLQQNKGSAEQMIGMMTNAGVKPAELEHAGMITPEGNVHPDWAGRTVTRDELHKHLVNSMPKVEEKVLGSKINKYPYRDADEWQLAISRAERNRNFDEAERLTLAWEEAEGHGGENAPKYKKWSLPGGENYREVLLKLPYEKKEQDKSGSLLYRNSMPANKPPEFQSTHWNAPNVLAHVRMSDREGPNGEKLLHVEELQSDWGQAGRERGFAKKYHPDELEPISPENITDERKRNQFWNFKTPDGAISVPKNDRWSTMEAAKEHILNTKTKSGVSEAPYVTSTQGWTDLALKRVLKEAAEGGYHGIVFTPGAEQAKRYPGMREEAAQGLQKFYDNIVTKRVQELAKQHDKDAKLGTLRTNSLPDMLHLPVTDKMRESVLKGQKAFADGGEVEEYRKGGRTSVKDAEYQRRLTELLRPDHEDPAMVQRYLRVQQSYEMPTHERGAYSNRVLSMPAHDVTTKVSRLGNAVPQQGPSMSWHQFHRIGKGGTLFTLGGDRSNLGRLTHINGEKLAWPVNLHAGTKYMTEPNEGAVWANAQGAATALQNNIREASKKGPVYGVFAPMGPTAVDSSNNMFDALMAQVPKSGMSADTAEAIDKSLRAGLHMKGKNPKEINARKKAIQEMEKWPGIMNAEKARDFAKTISGAHRAAIVKHLESAPFQNAGFPSVGLTRAAITDPEMLSVSGNMMGHHLVELHEGEFDPKNLAFEHSTYPVATPGKFIGKVPLIERHVAQPDFVESQLRDKSKSILHPYSPNAGGRSGFRGNTELRQGIQPINDRMLESIEEKHGSSFAKGGTAKAHPASIIPGVHIVGHNPIFHGDE